MKSIAKIAAYILVFYEKRPSETVKVGVDNNISWEIANIESGSDIPNSAYWKTLPGPSFFSKISKKRNYLKKINVYLMLTYMV